MNDASKPKPPEGPDACRSEEVSAESPCIGTCVLSPDAVCIGCYRSSDEITVWAASGEQRRRQINANAAARRSAAR